MWTRKCIARVLTNDNDNRPQSPSRPQFQNLRRGSPHSSGAVTWRSDNLTSPAPLPSPLVVCRRLSATSLIGTATGQCDEPVLVLLRNGHPNEVQARNLEGGLRSPTAAPTGEGSYRCMSGCCFYRCQVNPRLSLSLLTLKQRLLQQAPHSLIKAIKNSSTDLWVQDIYIYSLNIRPSVELQENVEEWVLLS